MRMFSASAFSTETVEGLEQQLKRSLRPVLPDQDFVSHLHTRLRTPVTTTLEERRNLTALSLLLVAFSLLSGVLLIWVLRPRTTAAEV